MKPAEPTASPSFPIIVQELMRGYFLALSSITGKCFFVRVARFVFDIDKSYLVCGQDFDLTNFFSFHLVKHDINFLYREDLVESVLDKAAKMSFKSITVFYA